MTDQPCMSRHLAEIFEDEALWDADDTDEVLLRLADDVAQAIELPIAQMRDPGDNSLLHLAAIWDRPVVMERLVRDGAALNYKNLNGHTPLDLAMHYGHVDLALQLRQYGAKHSCESERDIAIAQRDLAQQQMRECDLEMQNAVVRWRDARQEREQLRIECERAIAAEREIRAECAKLVHEKSELEAALVYVKKANHELRIHTAQLQERLESAEAGRDNAVQSWQLTQQVVEQLQQQVLESAAREEAANRLREEALQDRDVARELASQADRELGLVRQSQLEAETERAQAVQKFLDVETANASEKELLRRQSVQLEAERRNIQIEIDRQTARVRSECTRLEGALSAAQKHVAMRDTQMDECRSEVEHAKRQQANDERQIAALQRTNHEQQARLTEMEKQQRDEHRSWRQRIELSMREMITSDLRQMLHAATATWEKLQTSCERIVVLEAASAESLPRAKTPSKTPQSRTLQSSLCLSDSCLARSSELPQLLPPSARTPPITPSEFVRESEMNGLSSHGVPCGAVSNSQLIDREWHYPGVQSLFSELESDLDKKIAQSRALEAVELDQEYVGQLRMSMVDLCETVERFLELATAFMERQVRHFRVEKQAHDKMVTRKDGLIQRFNEHRIEKLKHQPAHLRDCLHKLPS